jgi:hypothetical protein
MMRRRIMAGALLVALSGCARGPETSAPQGEPVLPALPELAADGVRASLVSLEPGTVVLRLDTRGVSLGSVQGRIRFDPAGLAVSAVESVSGAFTVANVDSLAHGLVRFAAFSPGTLATGRLLRLRLAGKGSLGASGVRVSLEAAGTAEGQSLQAFMLHATRGVFRDAP